MSKTTLKKLAVVLLIIAAIISSFFLTSTVNATSIVSNEKRKVTPDIEVDDIVPLSIEEEKIMEYDATTGITREVNMNELKQSLNTRKGGYSDRIESYDPLAEDIPSNTITPHAIYNPVPNVTDLPYRATCRIKADVYGEELVASGYVAGPKIVVTAAHCVMNQKDNDAYFADWVAYPGYNNGSSYKGVSSGWAKVYYSSGWTSTHSTAYDWCICILNSDIGNTTGWLGTQSYGSNSEMNGLSVRLLGYPLSVGDGECQYYTSGTISNTRDLYFESSARSVGGFSGGPVARTSDNYVVGVNHGYYKLNPETETGARITQDMINIIRENM